MLEPAVLIVAGSDSGAGAGIQADLKTCMAFGVHGCTAITAITAQNTCGVRRSDPLPASWVTEQMRAVLDDFNVASVKIGMLGNEAVVCAVAEVLESYPEVPVVLDPVMVSSSGAPLLNQEGIEALKQRLLPLCALVTPNIAETALLSGIAPAVLSSQLERAGRRIQQYGADAVLIKGGHIEGEQCVDLLCVDEATQQFEGARISTPNSHGTGCTLASGIAASLARGHGLAESIASAKAYLANALQAGSDRRLGGGCGPMQHAVAVPKKKF